MASLRWKKNGPVGHVAFTTHGMYVDHQGSVSYTPTRQPGSRVIPFTAIRGGRDGAQEHHEEQLQKGN